MKKILILATILVCNLLAIAQNKNNKSDYNEPDRDKAYLELGLKTLLLNDNTLYLNSKDIESKSLLFGIGANYIFDPLNAEQKKFFINLGLSYFRYNQTLIGSTPFSYEDIDYFDSPTTEIANFNFNDERTFDLLKFEAGANFKLFDENDWNISLESKANYFYTIGKDFKKDAVKLDYGAIYDAYGSPIEFPTIYYQTSEINVENAYGREFLLNKDLNETVKNPFAISLGFNVLRALKTKHLIGLAVDYHFLINNSFVYKNSNNTADFIGTIKEGNERHDSEAYIFNIEDPNYVNQLNYFDKSKMFPIEIGISYYYKFLSKKTRR